MNKLHIGSKKKKVLIGVAIVVGVYASYTVGWTVGQNSPAPSAPQNITSTAGVVQHPNINELVIDINIERTRAGEDWFTHDPRLDASAQAKCDDMVRLNEWAHNLSDGTTPYDFIKKQIPNGKTWGENLAYDTGSSQQTVDAWIFSPEHKTNILNPKFTRVGYAICSTATYPDMVVQQFEGDV